MIRPRPSFFSGMYSASVLCFAAFSFAFFSFFRFFFFFFFFFCDLTSSSPCVAVCVSAWLVGGPRPTSGSLRRRACVHRSADRSANLHPQPSTESLPVLLQPRHR